MNKYSDKKTLKLVIQKKWFDMILSGEKKEEYREIKPFYLSRLTKNGEIRHYDILELINGYQKNASRAFFEIDEIKKDIGNLLWGAVEGETYFVISIGKLLEKNV